MKYILLLTGVLFTTLVFSQKIKIKDDIAYVDGVSYLNWKTRYGSEISIWGLSAEKEEIFISYQSYNDPNKVTNANPNGKVSYVEINFLLLKMKCEYNSYGQKELVKFLIQNKVYVNGEFNRENAELVVQKYGTKYTDNRPGKVSIEIKN